MNAANVVRDIACIVTVRGTQVHPALPQNCCALVALGVCRYVCPLGAASCYFKFDFNSYLGRKLD